MTTGLLAMVPEGGTVAVDVDRGLAQLFHAEAERLLGMLTAYTGDRAAAEDLVQEAFVRVHRAWPRLRDPDRAAAYLRSVGFNLARSRFRRLAVTRRHEIVEATDEASAEDDALGLGRTAAVLAAVRTLPDRQRQCVILRFYGGLSEVETAEAAGMSPSTVKTHVRRALATLEHRLGDER